MCYLLGEVSPNQTQIVPTPTQISLLQPQGALLNLPTILSVVLLVLHEGEGPKGHVHHYIPMT